MANWKEYVKKVTPYIPGEQPKEKDIIKLNTNENPYPPAPAVEKRWKELHIADFTKYPDPTAGELVRAIATYYGIAEQEVFVGVGSDDVLAMAFMTFFHSILPVLFADVTYSFYEVWADLFSIKTKVLPLDAQMCIQVEDYIMPNGGIIIANPNAPTGMALPLSDIESLLEKNTGSIVIIDEAYVDFGAESAISLTKKYENLLVVQTFSKSRSMAGLRIGFAVGHASLIEALLAVKYAYNSYTLNLPSIVLGSTSIKEETYFRNCIEKVIQTRERTKVKLEKLGFICLPSKANFLFVTHAQIDAENLYLYLKKRKIFVRYFKKPRIDAYLRISIGTDAQMDALIEEVKGYICKH